MMQREIQELINKIALKYDKPVYVIEELFMSQWKFVKERISKEEPSAFKTIKLPKWGKYYLAERKLNHIKSHNKKREDNAGSKNKTDDKPAA